MDVKITAEPFSWTDKLADTAIEDFESYQKDMSYGASTSIGLALEKLKMIEEGYLVELPCKPGDTVYILHRGHIQDISIISASVDLNGFWYFNWIIKGDDGYGAKGFYDWQIGKTVFLTYQEAMEALEGMRND